MARRRSHEPPTERTDRPPTTSRDDFDPRDLLAFLAEARPPWEGTGRKPTHEERMAHHAPSEATVRAWVAVRFPKRT